MSSLRIILITGTSGSGKTALVNALEASVDKNIFSIQYFDDRNIPSFEEMIQECGSLEAWQEAYTVARIKKLIGVTDVPYVVLEGSFNPEFATDELKRNGVTNYTVVCIHADRKVREERLITLRRQPELATQDMENFAHVLKTKTVALGGTVLDSTDKSIDEMVKIFLDAVGT